LFAVVLACSLATAHPASLAAQQPRHGAIEGTAIDSLHGRALTGALVTVEGVGRSAFTDADGEFRIDSVPAGTYRLAVFHPLLDTVGLTLVTQRLRVPPDSTLGVIVATPSPSTVLALKCGTDATAAVIGRVSRADDPDPPLGASVLLTWTEVQIGRAIGVRNLPRNLGVPVADDGSFRMCGVLPGTAGQLRAILGADTSGAVGVSFEEWPVLVIAGFVLAGEDVERVALAPPPEVDDDALTSDADAGEVAVATLRRGKALVSGLVVDSTGAPVDGARVFIQGALGAAVTDSAGRFFLRDQPSGSGLLIARKIGLAVSELPVIVSAHGRNEFTVEMRTRAVTLAEVVVRANRLIALERVGFHSRQQRGKGSYFLDVEQMDGMANRVSLANVLAHASNLTYRQGKITGRYRPPRASLSVTRSAQDEAALSDEVGEGGGRLSQVVGIEAGFTCVAYLIDGELWPSELGDASEVFLPREVAAIEVYRAGQVPMDVPYWHYVRGCETVVVWTRHKLRVP
jgi:hypothetical protein